MARWSNRWAWAVTGGAAVLGATFAQRRLRAEIAADPEREFLDSTPHGRSLTVRSADGTSLHAEVFGASGPTIVLVHGWTEALRIWAYTIRDLVREDFRVVAFDLRGHGDSDPAAGDDYSIERFGEDVEAVLREAVPDGERVVLAGHSLGAMSIVAWADEHDVSGRSSAIALINTGLGNLTTESLLVPVPGIARALNAVIPASGFLGARAPLPHFSTPLSHAATRYIAFGPTASPAQVAFFERMLLTCPPEVRGRVGLTLSELDLIDALPKLDVPTLVIAGERDRLTPPSHARRIAELVPNLHRLLILPGTGHMAPLEQAPDVSAALIELARKIAQEPTAADPTTSATV